MKTFEDLLEDLKREEEVTLLELFDITSETLVKYMEDFIYDNQDKIRSKYYGQDEETLDW